MKLNIKRFSQTVIPEIYAFRPSVTHLRMTHRTTLRFERHILSYSFICTWYWIGWRILVCAAAITMVTMAQRTWQFYQCDATREWNFEIYIFFISVSFVYIISIWHIEWPVRMELRKRWTRKTPKTDISFRLHNFCSFFYLSLNANMRMIDDTKNVIIKIQRERIMWNDWMRAFS